MMLDIDSRHGQMFVMPPPMAGFFEFCMMRLGGHYDQKLLAEPMVRLQSSGGVLNLLITAQPQFTI